jgi:L-2-hydroxyglutarate oxidase
MEPWDVTVVGGGILGTSVAYWLAHRYEGRIAVLEREPRVAEHTSRRNTGVVHRPFYLDPIARRIFARSANVSYGLWKAYARTRGLPWSPVGTLEIATDEARVARLEKYLAWGPENGMSPEELELLTPEEVHRIEPHLRCHGGLFAKTDTGVDYRAFTRALQEDAEHAGAAFLTGREVVGAEATRDAVELLVRRAVYRPADVPLDPRHRIHARSNPVVEVHRTRFLINCAGGNAIDLAHMLGVGLEYADLHFRGEYWEVRPEWAYLATHNVYTVPKHPDLPFLDPHWIVRADGRREIGPNAVPVPTPTSYTGFPGEPADLVRKLFEAPVRNKARLLVNPDFLTLAAEEAFSSVSKRAMARRVRRFLPELRTRALDGPGIAGIRASVVDREGRFVKEAIQLPGPNSYHVLNFNSPGATGAPAYTAWVVKGLAGRGYLAHLKERSAPKGPWDIEAVVAAVEAS